MNVPFVDIKEQYSKVKEEILKDMDDILTTCSFVGGSYVKRFENEFREYLGVKHVVSCGNGTEALVLALRACGVGPGDEVITSPFSFFATAEAIASVGAEPVFVDINLADFTIDCDEIERFISKKTKAIVPVHIFGACCDMDRIMSIARQYDLKVIEDAAQAVGSQYKGRKAGTLGDVGCFSFYPTKNLGGAGDGGACTTNDDELAINLAALKDHGSGACGAEARKNLLADESAIVDGSKYANYIVGYNSRLDAFQACVLSHKLKHLDEYNKARKLIAEKYTDYLSYDLDVPVYESWSDPCWHQFVVQTSRKAELREYLDSQGIGSGEFYPIPLHKQPAFDKGISLENAEKAAKSTVCLPIYPEMSDEAVWYVIETVNKFFEGKTDFFAHATAEVNESAHVGAGTKIWNDSQVREKAVIGENCNIGKNVYVDFDVVIGDRVKIQNNVSLFHGVEIEDDVFIGPSVTFTNDMYPRAFNGDFEVSKTVVKNGASIGANSTIRCGVTIGKYAMIGCGSVVTNDVGPFELVVGNPARKIGEVNRDGEIVLRFAKSARERTRHE